MLANINNRIRKVCVNNTDWIALISIALVIIFIMTLCTVCIFPIYPDEIQVRFWLSRLPYDFPERISGAPACLATFFQPIPATMYLPGFINWLIHGKLGSMFALRQVGVVVVFLWVTGLALYLNNRAKQSMAQAEIQLRCGLLGLYVAGFFIAIFSVGVFPLFLVTNRGEQLILPSVVLLITIFLVSDRLGQNANWRLKTGLIVLYFVSVSMILYGHVKGLLLTPLFIIVGWQLFICFKSRLPFAFAMALLFLHIAQDLAAWKYAFQCSELPQFEALLKSFSLDPASLLYDHRHFINQVSNSLIQFPKYLHQLGFQEKTDAYYLPIIPLATSAKIANFFIKLNISISFIALLIVTPFKYFRNDIASNRYVTINLVLLVTFVCVLISAIFNIPKNWYDAGYIYSLFLVIAIFFIGENFSGIFQISATRKILLYLGAVALLSQAVFIHRYLTVFMDGYAGPGVSIVKYDAVKTHNDLTAASLACGIDPVNSKKVVVDDYSYLFFQKSQWPMAISYIWFLPDDRSIREFFSQVDSDGLIVNCSVILAPYRAVVKREGNICCIPKNELKNLLSLPYNP